MDLERSSVDSRQKPIGVIAVRDLCPLPPPPPRTSTTVTDPQRRSRGASKKNIDNAMRLRASSLLGCSEASYRRHHRLSIGQTQLQEQPTMLTYTTDDYDGVTIDEASFPDTTENFKEVLQGSLTAWRVDGKRGVWLKVTQSLLLCQD